MSAIAGIVPERAEIAVVAGVMSGEPVFVGTRIPVETILIYMAADAPARVIYEDYPTLPSGAIEAAERWARKQWGADWRGRIGPNGFLP